MSARPPCVGGGRGAGVRSVHPRGQSHHCSARWSRTLCSQDTLGPCSASQVAAPSIMQGGIWSSRAEGRPGPMALLIDTEARTVKSQLKGTALVIPVGVTWPQHFRRTPDYRAPSAACSPRPSSEKTKERGQRPPWPARVQGGDSGLGRANGVQPGTHEAPFLLQG